jgi:hypothetical protein
MTYPPPAPRQQHPPQEGPTPPPQAPRNHPTPPPARDPSRRKLLLGAAGGAAALLGGGTAAAVLLNRSTSASDSGGGSDAGAWNPDTLPTAADGGGIAAGDIQALIEVKNHALTTRDRGLFISRHSRDTAAAAGLLFDNLGKVPFSEAGYRLLGQGSRDFAAGSGATVAVDVAFVHEITGVDVRPVAEWYRWSLSRPSPGVPPTITAVTGSPSVNQSQKYVYYPSVWDSPHPITVIRRPNVVMAAETDRDAAVLTATADLAQQAVAENLAVWKQGGGPAGISPGVFYLGTSNRDQFYSWYSGRANAHGFEAGLAIEVASAASMDDFTGMTTIGGARVVLDLTAGYFTQGSGEGGPKTLYQHEAWHAMLYPLLTATFTSQKLWVVEGVAEWAAKHGYSDAVKQDPNMVAARELATGALGTPWDGRSLPTDAQVYAGSGVEMNAGYGLSRLAFDYIAARWGVGGVIKFAVANYQAPPLHGTNGGVDLGAAVRTSFGVDLDTFQRGYAAYVHSTLGV